MRFQRLKLLPLADYGHLYSWEEWMHLVRQGFVGTVWNDGGGWHSNDQRFIGRLLQGAGIGFAGADSERSQ